MKKLYTLCTAFAVLLSFNSHAQLDDVSLEIYYTDDGTVAGYPAGHTTWRLYAHLEGSNDFVSGVYAVADTPALQITSSTGQIWNAGTGGTVGSDINPAVIDVEPLTEYDSFVTIGQSESNGTGAVDAISTVPSLTEFTNSFNTTPYGPNLNVTDGIWFNLFGDPDALPVGPDNSVLIAQVTTDGDIEMCLNFQIFVDNDQTLVMYDDYCASAQSPLSVAEGDITPLTISPNPMQDEARINFPSADSWNLEIFSITGQLVRSEQLHGVSNYVLQKNELPQGMYFIRANDGTKTYGTQLIIE